jgi:membrane-bound serine protease (ClpP class)
MDSETLSISLPLIGGTALIGAGFFVWVITRLFKFRKIQSHTGTEQMIGSIGRAVDYFDSEGRVRVHSESWKARTRTPLRKGQPVRVLTRQGLVLTVEPVTEEHLGDS